MFWRDVPRPISPSKLPLEGKNPPIQHFLGLSGLSYKKQPACQWGTRILRRCWICCWGQPADDPNGYLMTSLRPRRPLRPLACQTQGRTTLWPFGCLLRIPRHHQRPSDTFLNDQNSSEMNHYPFGQICFLNVFYGFIRERPYWTHTRDHAFYLVKSLQSPLKQWRIPQESPPFFRPDPSTPPRDGARREAGAFQVGIRWDLMVI